MKVWVVVEEGSMKKVEPVRGVFATEEAALQWLYGQEGSDGEWKYNRETGFVEYSLGYRTSRWSIDEYEVIE